MTKTKIEIIDETVEFYKNNPRSVLTPNEDRRQVCLYHGPDGKRCAFSRCCQQEIDLSEFEGQSCSSILQEMGDTVLQEEYRQHDATFWAKIQYLHDSKQFWKQNQLTASGHKYVVQLKTQYK